MNTATCPTQADEHERSLISSVLYNPDAVPEAVATVSAADFRRDDCQRLWLLIHAIHQRGEPVNLLSLASANGETLGELEHRLTIADLADVTEYRGPLVQGDVGAWRWHAGRVQEAARKRRLAYFARDIERAAMNGEDVDAVLSRATEGLRKIQDGGRSEDRFPAMTCADLDAMECDDDYLIDDVLTEGQPGLIGGPKKSLKTNASIDLVLSLATGAKFLNHFYVRKPCRAALISGESGIATIQETARRVAWSKQWSLREIEGAFFTFNLPNLSGDADLLHLSRYVEKHSLQVLVLDPAYLCLDVGEGAGNLFVVGKQLKPLSRLSADHGLTILLNVHARKRSNTPYEAMELEDVAWAGFQEWARQWLLINRREPYMPDNPGSHRLWFGTGGSAGHSGLWGLDIEEGKRNAADENGHRIPRTWNVSATSAAKIRAENATVATNAKEERKLREQTAKYQANRGKLMDALSYYPGGETLSTLATRAKLANKIARVLIEDMTDDGLIEDVEITKNRRVETGFRLTKPLDDEAGRIGRTEDCPGGTVRPGARWSDNSP